MENTIIFDVLIVYTDCIATTASSREHVPFSQSSNRAHYNAAYAYFLQKCSDFKLNAAFTTSADMLENGSFSNYWTFEHTKWIKHNQLCYSNLIFDKFSPANKIQRKRRNILFSNRTIKPFNNSLLFDLFYDKYNTYKTLKEFTIPTVRIQSKDAQSIKLAIDMLNTLMSHHQNNKDFSQKIVVKDRFGAGGNQIYGVTGTKMVDEIKSIMNDNRHTQFVIQPFTKFKNGFSHKTFSGFIDIRIIYLSGEAVQTYIRIAKKNDFRCNEHQGGALEYIRLSELPKKIRNFSDNISRIINHPHSLYALDFIISDNGNMYLVEGNTGPGIDWNLSLKKNERNAKLLIRKIVENISDKVIAKRDIKNLLDRTPIVPLNITIPSVV